MRVLFGTTNIAKLQHIRNILKDMNIEIISLNDVNLSVGEIDESGNNPLTNAKIKALTYYKAYKAPVFSCDSGLYIYGVQDILQPGVHVRRVNGRTLNDEEMIEYYSNIASSLNGKAIARYKNAISLVLDEKNVFSYAGNDISSTPFLLATKPHNKRTPGFPLDSLSKQIESGQYYMDLSPKSYAEEDEKMTKGFRDFFIRALRKV